MQYIESPSCKTDSMPSVFLAGGITGTSPWQPLLVAMLAATPWTVINPRREDFPADDPDASRVQIAWEYEHLGAASLIAFWFPAETLCPITLYELGAATKRDCPILVGTDPQYARRFDVVTQLKLCRPDIVAVDSLEALAKQIAEAFPAESSAPLVGSE